ncbi:MAG: MFS transporter [Chloroflexi bacterium]|nr:MAG: MFS transporter [Chloroflexota bacterium]MBL1194612.1 MFS transporter [Chloroflexota bacterium]NOH11902.1 MFS transporter [Chloroflexota bacterium]
MAIKKLDPVLIYLVAAFVTSLSTTMAFTTSVIYRVQAVGLDPLQLVLVGTTLEATVFLFEIPTGVVADVYSRRLSIIVGGLLVGLGFMIEGFAPLFAVVLLSQVVWGLGWTFISGANSAWISDEVGVQRATPLFLRGGQLGLLGNLAGIPISVWLAEQSLGLPFIMGGGLRILLVIFLIAFMPETGFQRKPLEERESWQDLWYTVRAGLMHVRQQAVLMTFTLIALFVGFYSEGWDRLGGALLLERFTFPDLFGVEMDAVRWFGLLGFVGILLGLGASEIAKRFVDQNKGQGLPRILQGLYAGMVLGMFLFAFTGNFFLAILAMLSFNTLRTVTHPLTEAWLNQNVPSRVRATVLSMAGQLDALGETAGGPIIGAIGSLRSLRAALITSAMILLPSVPLWGYITRQSKQAE